MKSWVTIALVLGLCAGCRPSDQKVDSVREQVMAGDYVEFKDTGYSLCGSSFAWDNMRLGSEDERMRIIVKKQQAFIQPGFRACYRVGDEISIEVVNKGSLGGGRIRITSVGLVLLDKLYGRNASKLSGPYFKATDNLEAYKGTLKSRMFPEMEGVVTVVNFVYISGTADDEAVMKQKDKEMSETDGFKETEKDGDTLASCKTEWTDFAIKPDVLEQIKSGELRSWYNMGPRNCLKQGAEAVVRISKDLASPPVIRVKVTKIKKFRVRFVDAKFFNLNGFPYATLKEMILKDDTGKNNEFMTVIDFDYLGEVAK